MTFSSPVLGSATQLGFVVRDLEAAVAHWTGVLGVGPFLVLEEGTGRPPAPSRYRGQEVRIETRLAFGFVGEVQLEFIEQVNDAPSPYRAFLEAGCEGLQHLGYSTPDHPAARARLEAAGYRAELEIPILSGEPILYYAAPGPVGPMIEIVPARWRPARAAVAACLRRAAAGEWVVRRRSYAEFLAAEGVTFG